MATLDASIYGQQRQAQFPDPIQQYSRLAQLQSGLNQQDMQRMQMDEMQRSRAEEAQLRDLFARSGGDVQKAIPELYRSGLYKPAMAIEKQQTETRAKQAEISKNEAETVLKGHQAKKAQLERVASVFGSVVQNPTPESAQMALAALKQDGVNVDRAEKMLASGMPIQAWAQQLTMEGVTADKQIEDARVKAEGILNRGVTTRGQDMTAGTAIRGQDLSAQTAIRGQDVGAQTAAAGHGVTMRGQNMTAQTAATNADIARQTMERADMKFDSDRGILVNQRTGEVIQPTMPATQDPTAQQVSSGGVAPIQTSGPAPGAPLGPKPQKPTEAYLKQQTGVENVRNAIGDYREKLKDFNLVAMATPAKRAEMGTNYNNMMLQAKEAYNLGVLNGPDYMILQAVVADPTKAGSLAFSRTALDKQASELDRIMKQVGQTSAAVHNQPVPNVSRPTPVDPSETPAKITGMSDYAKLPSGVRYIDPNGVERTKK